MKTIILSGFLLIALLSLPLQAQKVFDVYSFSVPDYYRQEKAEQSLILSEPGGKLSFVLIPLRQANDIPYVEFGNDWSQYITSGYSVLGFPKRATTGFPGGWEMTTGQAKIFNDKVTLWAQVRSFTRQGKKATIVIFAIDDKQQELIGEFMKSLSLSEVPVASSVTVPVNLDTSAPVKSQPSAKESAGASPEIWMRLKMGAWNMSSDYYLGNYYDLSKNRMAYKVLLPDGSYTGDEIPRKGLSGFDRKSPDAGNYTWGRYTRSAAGISFKSAYEDVALTFKTPDILENPASSFPYYRCKKVDGLKLNGSWSYIPDSEKDPYYDEPGCRQVIIFREDLTFEDRGAFVSDCRYPNAYPEDAPGKGSYEIRDFTLTLRYSDGRNISRSFTGALMNDPFVRDEVIYIGGINFFKRKMPGSGNAGVTVKSATGPIQGEGGQMSYGNFKYRLPDGWIQKESARFLELYPKSVKEGEVFSVLLMQGKVSSASLEDELAILWDEFAAMMGAQKLNQVSGKNYNIEESGMTAAGWEYIYGSGDIRSNGDFFVHAYVIRAKEKIERVIVLSKTISIDPVRNNIDPTVQHYPYYLTITDFVFNLRFSNLTSPVLPAASAKGTGITGCWAGIGFMGGKLKTTFMIFFSNGQVYYGSRFPITGLYGLNTYADSERTKAYWGTYTFSNGKGEVKIRGSRFPVRIESGKLIAAPISEEHAYIRLPEVDNAALDGTWMITGENDIPCFITFRKDGTFTDRGALKVLDHSHYQYYSIADGGGSGKYAVRDHTIIFNYSDGRVLHIAFPGLEYDPSEPSPANLCLSFNQDNLVKQ